MMNFEDHLAHQFILPQNVVLVRAASAVLYVVVMAFGLHMSNMFFVFFL